MKRGEKRDVAGHRKGLCVGIAVGISGYTDNGGPLCMQERR